VPKYFSREYLAEGLVDSGAEIKKVASVKKPDKIPNTYS